jgi:hypothetical protein
MLYNIGLRCQNYKHFTHVKYDPGQISCCSFKALHAMDGTAYFARAVSYARKMFMKLTTAGRSLAVSD